MKKTTSVLLIALLLMSFAAFCGCSDTSHEESPMADIIASEECPDESMPEETSETYIDVGAEQSNVESEERTVINYGYVKAIWVSQFDMASVFRLDEKKYISAVDKIISNIKSNGLNTVIFQIRPYGDSFYNSEYYPPSRFTSGCKYDPVKLFVDACHNAGLSVHAWINPYRLETAANMALIKNTDIYTWYKDGSLREWQGRYYLDPSDEAAKQLICDGAREALTLYEFDGLHMDDYFYPTTDAAFDEKSFVLSGESDLKSFREKHVNDLVKRLYATTKSVDERLLYGISPSGNIDTVRKVYFADVFKWCSEEGYIDYIMPQIYFGFLHGSCPFDKTVDRWGKIVTAPGVRLMIGITLGKACSGEEDKYAGTPDGKKEWLTHKDVIARELEYVYSSKYCNGFTLFCYQYLYDPLTGAENKAIAAERKNFEYILK